MMNNGYPQSNNNNQNQWSNQQPIFAVNTNGSQWGQNALQGAAMPQAQENVTNCYTEQQAQVQGQQQMNNNQQMQQQYPQQGQQMNFNQQQYQQMQQQKDVYIDFGNTGYHFFAVVGVDYEKFDIVSVVKPSSKSFGEKDYVLYIHTKEEIDSNIEYIKELCGKTVLADEIEGLSSASQYKFVMDFDPFESVA